ncbi:hypothetical protein A7E78_09590 [Syntrophotalea acetylenivorans]|uniref:Uncharacterized protein n=1 Tax=Syntrophotalea acetylenivorans TaxID=1842532 RepID=A0A1L3GQ61_9BACT|nr:hypothetical protein [Syntrophotalea acetylenivorans]APG28067.1 hypothetical protein A7E78_09590 [Syntrophotalea acetylenivorans]
MTERMSFTIRRALLLPLGFLLLVQLALLVVSLLQGQPTGKILFVGGVVVLLAGLLADNLLRRIELDEEGITVCRIGRRRRMLFADLTEVEAVCLRKRLFVTLWVGESFLLVTNAYGGVAALFESLLQRIPSGLVSDEVKGLVEAPPCHNGNIIVCWFAVVFSLLILCQQFLAGS